MKEGLLAKVIIQFSFAAYRRIVHEMLCVVQMATAQHLILSSKISKEDFQMIRRVNVQGLLLLILFGVYAPDLLF